MDYKTTEGIQALDKRFFLPFCEFLKVNRYVFRHACATISSFLTFLTC